MIQWLNLGKKNWASLFVRNIMRSIKAKLQFVLPVVTDGRKVVRFTRKS